MPELSLQNRFAEKTNTRIDRNILLKIQQNIHRSSSDSFIITTAFFMASLMHAQLGTRYNQQRTPLSIFRHGINLGVYLTRG